MFGYPVTNDPFYCWQAATDIFACFHAAASEVLGWNAPWQEPHIDFAIEKNYREGNIPLTNVTIEDVASFQRLWKFDHAKQEADTPTFVVVAPNSGTSVEQMRASVLAFLKVGNVYLLEQRDPHYVSTRYGNNGLDQSDAALIDVVRRHPGCHLVGFSQSGGPAVVAAAWMFQNPEYKGLEPSSLTVVGSPINPKLGNTNNWAASYAAWPVVGIPIGVPYPGQGHMVIPGELPKLLFKQSAESTPANISSQAMTSQHIADTMERVFRGHYLATGRYKFKGELIDPSKITCPVIMVAASQDRICPPPQTFDLARLTPRAPHENILVVGKGHYDLLGREVLKDYIVPTVARVIRHEAMTLQPTG